MRKPAVFAVLAVAAALTAGVAAVPTVLAQGSAQPATATPAPSLSLLQIVQRLEAAGYTGIESVERKRKGYEVKAVDREGRRVELDVSALTGEVTKTELKRARRADQDRTTPASR